MSDELNTQNTPNDGARSAMIRRRRAVLGLLIAATAVIAVVVGVAVARQNDDDPAVSSVDDTVVDATVATTAGTTSPDTTVAATDPLPDTTAVPQPTNPPDTAAATTVPDAIGAPAVLAIDGSGNAVIVGADGTTTLLFDGPDPDDAAPTEGESISIDGVTVTGDGSAVFVGLCCEPVAGSLLGTTQFAGPLTFDDSLGFGHAPMLSADGTMLVRSVYDLVVVSDLALTELVSFPVDVSTGTVVDLLVSEAGDVVGLVVGPDGTSLVKWSLAGGDTQLTVQVSSATWGDEAAVSLAGSNGPTMYLAGSNSSTLTAYDLATLAPSGADIILDSTPRSAWVVGGQVRWVDQQRVLRVDDAVVPGEFVWVR